VSETTDSETVKIRGLGARGDGIAEDGTPVPYTLPGERAEIRREARRAALLGVAQASPDRVEPFCPYYMRCGGCRTQHLARTAELAWKRDLVAQALSQARLDVTPGPAIDAHGAGRRRLTLHVREIGGRAEAGLMPARSHALVPIDHCPITVPALHPAPEVARRLAAPLGHGRKPLDVAVTATDQGLDVDLRGHGPVSAGVGAALVRIAGELGLARLSLHGERLMEAEQKLIGRRWRNNDDDIAPAFVFHHVCFGLDIAALRIKHAHSSNRQHADNRLHAVGNIRCSKRFFLRLRELVTSLSYLNDRRLTCVAGDV